MEPIIYKVARLVGVPVDQLEAALRRCPSEVALLFGVEPSVVDETACVNEEQAPPFTPETVALRALAEFSENISKVGLQGRIDGWSMMLGVSQHFYNKATEWQDRGVSARRAQVVHCQ